MSTKLITFKSSERIENVIDGLIKHRISGAPVVNDKNELIGVISEGDCIKHISDSRYYNMPLENSTVEKLMVKNVETIDGNMNIFDAANKFLESKRRRFPIIENGKLVGQISQKDILKAALAMKGHSWK
jgi:CBS domain-containing protein